jgi:hypothetical protein
MGYIADPKVFEHMENNPYCVISGEVVPMNYQSHHWKTKGSGGSDEPDNLDRLMPHYHKEAHALGIKQMAIKYGLEKPRNILINKGRWTDEDEENYRNNRGKSQKGRDVYATNRSSKGEDGSGGQICDL